MYELHTRERVSGAWTKKCPRCAPRATSPFYSKFDYIFDNSAPLNRSLNQVSLSFIEKYENSSGDGGFGPVCSVYFTEEQLVEFIISAEKALKSIRS